ncbi:MAG: hypothetical protein AAF927_32915 [Bacteroidota bacterium]
MKTLYNNGAVLLMLILFAACQTSTQETSQIPAELEAQETESTTISKLAQISPPIPGEELAYMNFSVNASKEKVIKLENGTQITIPANSLLDAQGNPISGEAELTYREFHDVVDVLFSGIPMGVTDGDKLEVFQTAGMMEIRAQQNGAQLSVDPNKPIKVAMASYRFAEDREQLDTQGYGQYYLNEANGQWQGLQAQDQPQANPLRSEKYLNVAPLPVEPAKPRKASNPNEAFDFAVDYQEFPSLASFKNILWEYAEVVEAGTLNPNQSTWIFAEAWTDAKISAREGSENTFYVDLSRPNKKARMIVRPVVSDENFQDAMAIYQSRQAAFLKAKRANELAAAAVRKQSKVRSLFSVGKFGFYNIDRYYKFKKAKVVQAQITYQGVELEHEIPLVYHVVKDANAVIPYEQTAESVHYGGSDFRFFKREKNMLVSFIGGILYTFGNAQFRRGNIGERHIFQLKPSGEANTKNMRKLLGT